MSASRDLDAEVARKVMGLAVLAGNIFVFDKDYKEGEIATAVSKPIPPYSTSIEAAWQVVDRIAQNYDKDTGIGSGYSGNGFVLEYCTEQSEGKWVCCLPSTVCAPPYEVMDPTEIWVEAETAPLAICLAALKLVELKEKK